MVPIPRAVGRARARCNSADRKPDSGPLGTASLRVVAGPKEALEIAPAPAIFESENRRETLAAANYARALSPERQAAGVGLETGRFSLPGDTPKW